MKYERINTQTFFYGQMSEIQTQEGDSTQQQQQQQQQSYQDNNIYSAETEQLYLKMKEGWL